jgi:hypothetical protein
MLPAAALLFASADDAAVATKAQWALRRAETARFNLAVTVCGDAGRAADYRRLEAEQRGLEQRFRKTFGRFAIEEIVMDDRGDCQDPGSFRRYVTAYGRALGDAQDALGME